jgi:hypothetical protein
VGHGDKQEDNQRNEYALSATESGGKRGARRGGVDGPCRKAAYIHERAQQGVDPATGIHIVQPANDDAELLVEGGGLLLQEKEKRRLVSQTAHAVT